MRLMVALHSMLIVHMMPIMGLPHRDRLPCLMMIPMRTSALAQAQLWLLLRIQSTAKSLPSVTKASVLRKEAGQEVALSVTSRGAEVIVEVSVDGQAAARIGRDSRP